MTAQEIQDVQFKHDLVAILAEPRIKAGPLGVGKTHHLDLIEKRIREDWNTTTFLLLMSLKELERDGRVRRNRKRYWLN